MTPSSIHVRFIFDPIDDTYHSSSAIFVTLLLYFEKIELLTQVQEFY